MPNFLVSERQNLLVSATIEAENAEEAERIFLDGDPPGIQTKVLDSHDLSVEAAGAKHALDNRELAAILAGLRLYQPIAARFSGSGDVPPMPVFHTGVDGEPTYSDIADIATCGDEVEPLTAAEIDALCERLNAELPGAG